MKQEFRFEYRNIINIRTFHIFINILAELTSILDTFCPADLRCASPEFKGKFRTKSSIIKGDPVLKSSRSEIGCGSGMLQGQVRTPSIIHQQIIRDGSQRKTLPLYRTYFLSLSISSIRTMSRNLSSKLMEIVKGFIRVQDTGAAGDDSFHLIRQYRETHVQYLSQDINIIQLKHR